MTTFIGEITILASIESDLDISTLKSRLDADGLTASLKLHTLDDTTDAEVIQVMDTEWE